MKIVIAGGGPGGLYAAILLKKADASGEIVVIDRNPADSTYGWGVVFSDETLGFLEAADPETHAEVTRRFVHWEAIDIYYRAERVRSGGHAFSGMSRRTLLGILQDRCRDLGVELRFGQEIDPADRHVEADLFVAADGVNSSLRASRAPHFKPTFDVHPTRYIWLGMHLSLEAFTFVFRPSQWGMFQIHAYPFEPGKCTCIVECTEGTWQASGLATASEEESIAFCESLFSDFLRGSRLVSNRSSWLNFVTVRNETWYDDRLVLLGDSAHTAHFSIGSGTKIAMEDAIALAEALDRHPQLHDALVEYEELRQPVVERTQQAARDSSLWFEHVSRYAGFHPTQFAFSLLTRSKRVTYETLRVRDSAFGDQIDNWFARQGGVSGDLKPIPSPLCTPLRLRDRSVPSRQVWFSRGAADACDGCVRDEHLLQVARKAPMGAGLVMVEALAVSAPGRITPGCPGLYREEHLDAWRRLTDLVHDSGTSLVGAQLNHAGPRGATRSRNEGTDLPLDSGAWPLVAASAQSYSPYSQTPDAVDSDGMAIIESSFVQAAQRADSAGFDLLELHFGHGYLLASFLSPLTNCRSDQYGGSLPNRARFPLQIAAAVRAIWPDDRPLSVCFSGSDWARGGTTLDEAIQLARWFRDRGADLIHVVSGQTTFRSNPPYGRSWEAHLADAIRNRAEVATMTGGQITNADEANTLLAAGRADLCCLS